MSTDDSEQLVDYLRSAQSILVFTGAGISTGSGIRDFRGPNGVWKERQPVYYDQFMSSETARVEYWDYKAESWPSMRDAIPNPVHEGIVDLERAGKLLMVVTQNIDGLHSRAGLCREKLIELHGSNGRVECQSCHAESDPDPHFEEFKRTGKPPACSCGGFLKPATISFGQSLRPNDLEAAEQAAREADLVVSLGSSLSVYPASEIPLIAARRDVPYAVVNRGPTDHDACPEVTLRLEGDVVNLFPPAVKQAQARASR
ncbi:MAG: SIR2 family NAD-dependent protein deacylase [Verrucomicrobiia bacterium]|jgi:NAD-dependent deacetylase